MDTAGLQALEFVKVVSLNGFQLNFVLTSCPDEKFSVVLPEVHPRKAMRIYCPRASFKACCGAPRFLFSCYFFSGALLAVFSRCTRLFLLLFYQVQLTAR
eukprot:RCo016392